MNRSNLTGYVFPSNGGLPAIKSAAGGGLTFDFLRRNAATTPGVSYTPRVSTDLTAWQPVSLAGATITAVLPGWERVTLTVPPPPGGRLYGSVEITRID